MVVRLAENGCLLNFLQKSRENPYVNVNQPKICFTRDERIRTARDIANGMLHLSNKRVRSTRNGEIWTVRIILYSRSRCTRYIRRILCSDWPAILGGPGARFSKVPIINGPGKLSRLPLKIEVSTVLHLT